MRVGLHVSIASGLDAAVDYAARLGCTAIQIFSGNAKTYRVASFEASAFARFQERRLAAGIDPAAFHTSYLINLATDDAKIRAGSLRLLKNDLQVAAAGGVAYVNTHLGSYGNRPRAEGFAQVVTALEEALSATPPGVTLVMENSAGAGQLCGGTLEELGELVRAVGHPQLGVCLDTAHSWAAGYALNDKDGVDRFVETAAQTVSLERVCMFHFNDTQIPLGGHRDRHYHIGEGNIGFAGFRALAAHPELRDKVAILETPGDEADDARNMQTVRMIFEGALA